MPVFSKLTKTTLGKMSHFLEQKIIPKDSVIFREGDEAKYVYMIKSG